MGFLLSMERRTSPENPTTNLSKPAAWLTDYLTGGSRSTSGVRVNEQTAMQFSAVYACVRVISETIAYLPLLVYERLERGKKRAPTHPNYQLLHDRPNPELSAFNWFEIMQSHVELWGNAYAEKEYNGADKVIALWPLLPSRTRAERRNGRKVIITRPEENGPEVVLAADKVLHIPGLGFNGLNGFSVLGMMKQAIGLGIAAETFGANFYNNGATVAGVLSHPSNLSEPAQQRLRTSLTEVHTGLSNAHRVMILEEAMKYEKIGIPPEEAQFIQLRKFQKNDICTFFRVPPHMIQDLDRPFQSNVEQMGLDFIRYTMGPRLARWEQVLNWELFDAKERETYFAEFNAEGLLRGDSAARASFYQIMLQAGGIAPNEIAEIENFPTVEGGDERFVPMNLVPLSKAAALADAQINPPKADPQPTGEPMPKKPMPKEDMPARSVERIRLAHRRLLHDAASYFVTKEVRAAQTAARKNAGPEFVARMKEWAEEFYADHKETIRKRLAPVIEAMGCAAGDVDAEFLHAYVQAIAERHVGTSLGQLDTLLGQPGTHEEVRERVEAALREWDEKRAAALAAEHSVRLGEEIAVRSRELAA